MVQNKWYVFAQILVTLAGFLIIASSIFYSQADNALSLLFDSTKTEKPLVTDWSNPSSLLGTYIVDVTKKGDFYFLLATLFALLSISSWYFGVFDNYTKMDKNEERRFWFGFISFWVLLLLGIFWGIWKFYL